MKVLNKCFGNVFEERWECSFRKDFILNCDGESDSSIAERQRRRLRGGGGTGGAKVSRNFEV